MKLSLFSLLLLTCLQVYGQETRTLKLKNQPADHALNSFHIAAVMDDRGDTNAAGTIYAGLGNKKVNVNLLGGAAGAINTFIQKNVRQNNSTPGIDLHIKQLKISENHLSNGEQAVVEMSISYYIKDQMLIEYSSTASQQGSLDATAFIEGLVRKNVSDGLTRFDEWWAKHKTQFNTSGKMVAEAVSVTVEQGDANGKSDLIIYDTKQPLILDDFRGEPDDQNPGAAAVTYSGITVSYNGQVRDGKAIVKVTVTPAFSKSKSWCRTNSRNAHTLNHEQKHFDLTGLKACELIAEIKRYPFTPEHYEQELDDLREKALKELDTEQNLYDRQTNHGLIAAEQNRWTSDINKRVQEQSCY